jgi:hypothetical protein
MLELQAIIELTWVLNQNYSYGFTQDDPKQERQPDISFSKKKTARLGSLKSNCVKV